MLIRGEKGQVTIFVQSSYSIHILMANALLKGKKGIINKAVKGEWIRPVSFENEYGKDFLNSI